MLSSCLLLVALLSLPTPAGPIVSTSSCRTCGWQSCSSRHIMRRWLNTACQTGSLLGIERKQHISAHKHFADTYVTHAQHTHTHVCTCTVQPLCVFVCFTLAAASCASNAATLFCCRTRACLSTSSSALQHSTARVTARHGTQHTVAHCSMIQC
jgi:hypothetical protein